MKLSIIMYHYVRELDRSPYPGIKGLRPDEFGEQLTYIRKHYSVISADDLLASVEANALDELPARPLLLTFDDGYIDHFTHVFPILRQQSLPACFFPSGKSVLEREVLDVNKIHFVLASAPDPRTIIDHIFQLLNEHRDRYVLQSNEVYWDRLAVSTRLDSKEVVFVKRILQRELPEQLRKTIVDALFRKYVTGDELCFGNQLYLDTEQLVFMRENGMYIGSHGYAHDWLDSEPAKQKEDVELSLKFLKRIGAPIDRWIMCYPKGVYDDSLLSIVRRAGGRIGLTTRVAVADLSRDNLLILPRLDAIDLPMHGDAEPNGWTQQADTK